MPTWRSIMQNVVWVPMLALMGGRDMRHQRYMHEDMQLSDPSPRHLALLQGTAVIRYRPSTADLSNDHIDTVLISLGAHTALFSW